MISTAQNEDSIIAAELAEKYLTFVIEKQYYAFPIIEVKEIMEVQPITTVPEFPAYCKGVINIRGDIVPVIDVRLRFKRPETAYTTRTCIIVVNSGEQHIGFIVDEVDEVIDIKEKDTSPAPKVTKESSAYIKGVGKINGRIIMLLDSDAMVSEEDHMTFGSYLN